MAKNIDLSIFDFQAFMADLKKQGVQPGTLEAKLNQRDGLEKKLNDCLDQFQALQSETKLAAEQKAYESSRLTGEITAIKALQERLEGELAEEVQRLKAKAVEASPNIGHLAQKARMVDSEIAQAALDFREKVIERTRIVEEARALLGQLNNWSFEIDLEPEKRPAIVWDALGGMKWPGRWQDALRMCCNWLVSKDTSYPERTDTQGLCDWWRTPIR